MAFFDDLGKKLTSVSQSAVQKTKDVADIAKINAEISELERASNQLYYQIGKLYVAKHAADCESDFANLISSVIENEKKIAERRQKIQDIKGLIRCEKCGAAIPAGAAFCSYCGAAMPKGAAPAAAQDLEQCPSCGAMIPRGTRFCTACGKPMLRDAITPMPSEAPTPEPAAPSEPPMSPAPEAAVPEPPAPEPVQETAAEPEPSAQEVAGKVCSNCGAVNDFDCTFCTQCGNPL